MKTLKGASATLLCVPSTPTSDLDELEDVLVRIADSVSATPWGAPFISTVLATLIGVVIGALLSWLFAHLIQKRERADRYAERFDDRNLMWMDALDAFAHGLLEEASVFGAAKYSQPTERGLSPSSFTPSSAVEESLRVFRTRIRQASLIARGRDLAVLSDIEADVRKNLHDSTHGEQLDPEYITRMHMLVAAFIDYRRGELHASWFSYWRLGTQMPFVGDGANPRHPAPKRDPTTHFQRFPT